MHAGDSLEQSLDGLRSSTTAAIDRVTEDVATNVKTSIDEIIEQVASIDKTVKTDVQVKLDAVSAAAAKAIELDAVDARVAALEADASLAELQEDVAAIEATFGIPKVYSVSKSAPTKINIAQAGGDRIVLSGDGFSDDTKVELIEGEQTLKPKAVETNGEGTSLTVTMPKIVPSTSFCNGGDGKDGDVAVAFESTAQATPPKVSLNGKCIFQLPTLNSAPVLMAISKLRKKSSGARGRSEPHTCSRLTTRGGWMAIPLRV